MQIQILELYDIESLNELLEQGVEFNIIGDYNDLLENYEQ